MSVDILYIIVYASLRVLNTSPANTAMLTILFLRSNISSRKKESVRAVIACEAIYIIYAKDQ